MIERAARHASDDDDLRRAGLGIGLFGEELSRRADQIGARRLGAVAIGAASRVLLHTYSLYVICICIQTVCQANKEGKMKTTSYYPVLMTGDVAGTADFYVKHFRFEP